MRHTSASTPLSPAQRLRRAVILAVALTAVSACASVRGRPERITQADVKDSLCPNSQHMDVFAEKDGGDRGAYRDRIVALCIAAYNRRYADFTESLSNESISTNLAVDVASAGLTTLAGIAAPKTAKRLTAGAGLALGIGAAVNRDVFYNATLPALLTIMDAKRAERLTAILQAEQADPQGVTYSLAHASFDLQRYEEAGTLATGVNALNKAAGAAAEQAEQELANVQRGLEFETVVLDASVNTRLAALTRKVRALQDNPADRAKLDQLATALNMTPNAADPTERKRGYVITAMLAAVHTSKVADQNARITQLETDLTPLF
jgi:hypothetical protein